MVHYKELKGYYEVEKTIGCGGFAKVKLATHIATGEKVAIKIMDKTQLGTDLPRVKLEIRALKHLSHENICKLYQVIETERYFFIVIEYCSGGELFDHIVEKNRLTESESRMFFRQIVSAVAYLHSLGYAHRDLKPENILLDKNQNLKLIDFGLCAKPEGGIESLLKTSCGSPTYAAPELVLGQKYLGPEVDVWAMGILLYALLAGFLPFDDVNIDSLYKKILSGKYHQPSFMSSESKKLIKSMLQTDPKKRITVNDLLSHHWLTMDVLEPVQYHHESFKQYDRDCVNAMAAHYNIDADDMWKYLKRWKHDYHTATYMLLLGKKKRGSPLNLNPVSVSVPLQAKVVATPQRLMALRAINKENSPLLNEEVHTPETDKKTPSSAKATPENYLSPVTQKGDNENSSGQFVQPSKPSSIRKPLKRIRSPTLDDSSPVPAKKPTPGRSPRTPDRKRTKSSGDTPGSARRVLGSIERSLHKVRHVLTPRKNTTTDLPSNPLSLNSKELCNVSTTQCTDPEYVINQLQKGLEKRGISCERKGFSLRGKLEPNVLHRFGGCSFELEICYLPNLGQPNTNQNGVTPTKSILKNGPLNLSTPTQNGHLTPGTPTSVDSKRARVLNPNSAFVGIRRKRLKGDSWCYKKVCEEVLALTATDLKQVIESSV